MALPTNGSEVLKRVGPAGLGLDDVIDLGGSADKCRRSAAGTCSRLGTTRFSLIPPPCPNPESPDLAGILIWSSVSVVVGICAIVSGVKGRKLAKAEASGRISATTGLVLGIVSVAIPILEVLAFINWLSCCLDNI